jgi:hypothetical protein
MASPSPISNKAATSTLFGTDPASQQNNQQDQNGLQNVFQQLMSVLPMALAFM